MLRLLIIHQLKAQEHLDQVNYRICLQLRLLKYQDVQQLTPYKYLVALVKFPQHFERFLKQIRIGQNYQIMIINYYIDADQPLFELSKFVAHDSCFAIYRQFLP